MSKDTYLFISLFLVMFAGFGLLLAILKQLNIPLMMLAGAVIGIVVGTITDILINLYKKHKGNDSNNNE